MNKEAINKLLYFFCLILKDYLEDMPTTRSDMVSQRNNFYNSTVINDLISGSISFYKYCVEPKRVKLQLVEEFKHALQKWRNCLQSFSAEYKTDPAYFELYYDDNS